MVGLFTFLSVGAAVLWDLWGILDIKRGHPIVSYKVYHVLMEVLLLPTLRLSSCRPDPRPLPLLPFILLGPFQNPQVLWTWRQLYVACFPRDAAGQRASAQRSR